MPDYLLDTNILIRALRQHKPTLDLIERLQQQAILHASVITRAEVLSGMHAREETSTMSLLQSLNNLAVDAAIADQAGRWVYQYARQGIQLSIPVALIGATATRHKLNSCYHKCLAFPDV